MERRTAAVALTAIIIVSVVGGIVVVNHLNTTVELRWTAVSSDVYFFFLDNIRDAVVRIDFANDPTLIFRYSYELYADSTAITVESDNNEWNVNGGTARNSTGHYEQLARVKVFNLTLGRNPPNYLGMRNIVNSTVIVLCRNNATLTGFTFDIHCDDQSMVYFALENDVNFGDEGIDGAIWANTLYLSVHLPEGVSGNIPVHASRLSEINPWEIVGWHYWSGYYMTEETSEPLVEISPIVYSLHLWLYT